MANADKFVGNKVKELIPESQGEEVLAFDDTIWARTCTQEIMEPIEGHARGEIPKWVNGCFLQNGPGAYEIGDVVFNHVFDGMALLHRFNIVNGKATYQNRFVKSRAYEAATKENRLAFSEFGTSGDANGNYLQRFLSIFKFKAATPTDNTAVSIYPIGDDFYAFTETTKIHKFDTESLKTLDRVCLGPYTDIICQPAHPIVTEDGLYNVGLRMSATGAQYILFHIPNVENKFENVEIIAKLTPTRRNYPSYMHSFAMTENYFVVIEQPFTISTFELAKFLFVRSNILNTFKWFDGEPVYIHLIRRKTGEKVHTYETETFFFFHTINAYEDDNHVVLDVICYNGPDVIKMMLIENIMKSEKERAKVNSCPLRFVLPLEYTTEDKSDANLITLSGSDAKAYMQASGTVMCFPESLICDLPFEFGTLYFEKHFGRKYQFFYGVGMDLFADSPGQLIKVDTVNRSVQTWHEENVYPSEPLFVPSINATSEDDGVLVSALLRGKNETNHITLLVLDAKTFKELGRVEFKNLPTPIPKTLHGWFLEGVK